MILYGLPQRPIPFPENHMEPNMIDLKFEINGRRVDPRNMKDTLEAAVMDAVSKQIRQKIGSCRCSTHGKAPSVVAKGRDLGTLSFQVNGCCDQLIEDVKHRLS